MAGGRRNWLELGSACQDRRGEWGSAGDGWDDIGLGTEALPSEGRRSVMATRKPAVPAEGPISDLLEKVLPGKSKRARVLRDQVLRFCCDLSAKTVLLRGPIGAGKSTVARAIGFVRRVAPLSLEP